MDWNISSRTHVCGTSGKKFADGESYYTILFYRGKDGYQREDVCEDVWREKMSDTVQDLEGYVSHWRGTYRAPEAAPPDPIEKESAESLIRRLMERDEERFLPATYILAVMLERKRILKIRDEIRQEGRRVFVYEHVKSKDVLTIPEVELQLDQLERVQKQVGDLLEFGLDAVLDGKTGTEPAADPNAEAEADDDIVEGTVETESANEAANQPSPTAAEEATTPSD
jgi:hypothetical protein